VKNFPKKLADPIPQNTLQVVINIQIVFSVIREWDPLPKQRIQNVGAE